ncbi:peptide ABC transporter ATP-binding protein [Pandoraea communis]|uniref:Dipeptide transporter ATP-binding subunit n=1 Tax=Pandoraea communis TaxID=2508297 RepID=A0A5E4S1R3_9BURK|nr:peptide ABC transporter ATP-binding protein [Pandoraea communis]MDM8354570.1 ABC transporter ATP-binding protein [Pandoraea communis]VVD69530.1 dipeptide transporter ATP-binding subunit [Pandoraea communis]
MSETVFATPPGAPDAPVPNDSGSGRDGGPLVLAAQELTRFYTVNRGLMRAQATVKALNGVSFTLAAGRTLAVVGESGCGKSTLARVLTLIEPPTSGRLAIDAIETTGASAGALAPLRTRIQMVFQNPYASLNPRKTVGQALDEPLAINTSLSRAARGEKIAEMMRTVGLRPEHVARYPHMFSGGQRQRVAIARAMIMSPAIVVADEPVSALDVSIQAQILNLFMDLQDRYATSYVFVSHNLAVVEHVADDVMVMYLGRAVEHGPKAAVFGKPLHPYTKALMSATPAIKPSERRVKIPLIGELPSPLRPPPGCAFAPRCPYAIDRCRGEVPQLRKLEGRLVACHRVEDIEG